MGEPYTVRHGETDVVYLVDPAVSSRELNALFSASWADHSWRDFDPILRRSLSCVCAYHRERLVGFVNLAWDGGAHAFLLDVTVHPELRGRGIGSHLVRRAEMVARARGVEWLHVDFEPRLRGFYRRCGFRHTQAGLIRLAPDS